VSSFVELGVLLLDIWGSCLEFERLQVWCYVVNQNQNQNCFTKCSAQRHQSSEGGCVQ